jgi:hypothetical protein
MGVVESSAVVEYRVMEIRGPLGGWPSAKHLQEDLTEAAEEGWRVVTTVVANGSTVAILLERVG